MQLIPFILSSLILVNANATAGLNCPVDLSEATKKLIKQDSRVVARLTNPAFGQSIKVGNIQAFFLKNALALDEIKYLVARLQLAQMKIPKLIGFDVDSNRYSEPVRVFLMGRGAHVYGGYEHQCLVNPKPYIFISPFLLL